ncbi:MAG: T9SS type A sorting domain-containing protein [Flavipsychrobacter sp.]|nr:T9SS type A sorting domain-containing protein [Flavipsychrobacter sp.]
MKYFILLAAFSAMGLCSHAQITITVADMPVAGDTLRYSTASILGASYNLNDTGVNKAWDYRDLLVIAQQVDTYKTAIAVNPIYQFTAPAGCYGYKVADSVPGLSMIPGIGALASIKDLYTFFNVLPSPSSFAAVAFGATISNFPIASPYTINDEWYFFPLSYGRRDSSNFAFSMAIPTLGSLAVGGNRVTQADGWGTIQTPFYTTPVNCLRVRSEVNQIDTIVITALSLNFPVPSNTVDYKWLVNGEHYPALWITTTKAVGTETITGITYRDSARAFVGIPVVQTAATELSIYPNPTMNGQVKIAVPSSWGRYSISIYDIQGRELFTSHNQNEINISALPAGHYLVRVTAPGQKGYCVISK